jgi:hypothetical protein
VQTLPAHVPEQQSANPTHGSPPIPQDGSPLELDDALDDDEELEVDALAD